MRICQITSMHSWDDDRIYQRACLGLARKEDTEVHLIATLPDILPNKSSITFHWITPRTGLKRRWLSSREAIRKAIDVKADIYHFHDPDLLPHILSIKKALPKAKVIYDIHENYVGRFVNWRLPSFLGNIFRSYEKSIISKLDGYSVVSGSMLGLFQSVSTPSLIIRNSTDISRLRNLDLSSLSPFEIPTIYTSGTNSHARHCLQSVKSLKFIEEEQLDYQMLFVGRYMKGIEVELKDQAKRDGTHNKLQLEGMLPWEENFLRTAKAFCGCVFYEDNVNNRVGIPNRLFEYMYCGLPVVATDFPELRKIIEKTECGILVDSEDPQSIANGFIQLLKDPIKAKEMGNKGRKAIEEKYGYHIDIRNTFDFYKSLLNQC